MEGAPATLSVRQKAGQGDGVNEMDLVVCVRAREKWTNALKFSPACSHSPACICYACVSEPIYLYLLSSFSSFFSFCLFRFFFYSLFVSIGYAKWLHLQITLVLCEYLFFLSRSTYVLPFKYSIMCISSIYFYFKCYSAVSSLGSCTLSYFRRNENRWFKI